MAIVQAPLIAAPASPRIPSPPQKGLRDTGIDVVRALCVVGVVLLHAIMVGVTVEPTGPAFSNASDGSWWIVPVSWALQVMPLFFVIGGFSGLLALRRRRQRGGTTVDFVAARLHRLLRPAVLTVGIVAVGLTVLTVAGVPADLIAIAGFRYGQPLWFLGVFLLCQALLPVLAAAHERAPFRTIGALALASVVVDALRAVTGIETIGFLNLAFVWMTLQQLGFFLADGRIDALGRRTRILAAITAVALLLATFLLGIYSPDLIANINPPTAALLLVGIAHTSILSLHRGRLRRFSRHAGIAALTGFVTRRTMTIYLWHMPVLLTMAGASAVFAQHTGMALPEPGEPGWWAGRPLWLAVALALTAAVAVLLTRFETAPMPAPARSVGRVLSATLVGLLAVVLLLAAGTSVATAIIAVVLIRAALRLAGSRARPSP